MMKKQGGVGMFGMMFIILLIIFSAILLMRVAPAYIEYFAIKKVFAAMKNDPEVDTMTIKQVKNSFDRRATIDDIKSISGEDLEVSKEAGQTVIAAEYVKKVPLFGNLSLVMDFTVESADSK